MDVALYRDLNSLAGHAAWLDHVIKLLANGLPLVMGALLAGAWFWPGTAEIRGSRQRLVIYAVASALLGLALSQVIGHAWFRDRPYVHHPADLLLPPSADPSFPSDHAVGGFALAMPFLLARRKLGWVLLGLATLLGVARVAAGTHYPSDIVAGAVVGSAAAVMVWNARAWVEPVLAPCLLLARRLRLA